MPNRDFRQTEWDAQLEDDLRQLIRLAVREDLDRGLDWTTVSIVPEAARGAANVVYRQPGVVCGLRAAALVIEETNADLAIELLRQDGDRIEAGQAAAKISGAGRDLLIAERLMLNLVGRLSGVATLTAQYVERAAGGAAVYDTRKTTPGWRRLEKYAVRCGGGRNHRAGLYEAILIKDNHLALAAQAEQLTPADAVEKARQFVRDYQGRESAPTDPIVEVEVDTLDQLRLVLPKKPHIVLLDNMTPAVLREAVGLRNDMAPETELEASGGVNLETIGEIAQTGVERISVGALTHQAVSLDVGLDWEQG